eukprot:433809-Amphidinium_carterae.1
MRAQRLQFRNIDLNPCLNSEPLELLVRLRLLTWRSSLRHRASQAKRLEQCQPPGAGRTELLAVSGRLLHSLVQCGVLKKLQVKSQTKLPYSTAKLVPTGRALDRVPLSVLLRMVAEVLSSSVRH